MTRWWTERVADVSDVIALPLLALLLVVLAGGIGALWYWYPAWVPRRWPRLTAADGAVPYTYGATGLPPGLKLDQAASDTTTGTLTTMEAAISWFQ